TEAEKGNVKFRRSLYVVKDVKAGEMLTAENVRSIRPGFGLAPKYYDEVLNKKANKDIGKGTALSWSDLVD
ncbi:SAF domain-containing protein, partial [Vibrio alginolyticus]